MALEVWYQDDIRCILAALASAADLYGPEYHKALGDVGLAFGLLSQSQLVEGGQPSESFLEALVEWSEE